MLLIICDGRLSLSVCLLLLAFLPIARHLPERFSVLYLPACILALVLAARFGLLIETGDTFAGRLRYAVDAFGRLNIDHLLGISGKRVGMEDAGLAFVGSLSRSLTISTLLAVRTLALMLGEVQPGDRAPAPEPLALVQDFVNTAIRGWIRRPR